jgi:glutamine synthetase
MLPPVVTQIDPRIMLDTIETSPADYVKVAVVDLDGVLRGKYLEKRKFLAAAQGDGFGFCDVVFGWDSSDSLYDNVAYTSWKTGYPDGSVRIDLETHRVIPWEASRHFFLCDYVGSGAPFDVCPRLTLKAVVDRLESAGFRGRAAFEYEWFNFRESPATLHEKDFRSLEPLTPGMFGYSVLRQAHNQPYFDALLSNLRQFSVPLEGLHTETGPGVFEAAIIYSHPTEAADRAVLFKSAVKEIAHGFGVLPSFMARWNADLPGCGGHVHQSLWDAHGEHAFFHDPDAPHAMSDTFRHYLAGVLALLPELAALYCPTVNSYKRLVDGFWAPTRATWGIDNRTVACRVIPGGTGSTRLEVRVPGADANPYLALAAALASGLYGIEQRLELPPPTQGSGYAEEAAAVLPRTLQDATRALSGSAVARELFGDGFVDHFCATREWEWRAFHDAVTDWELRRYFEII